MDCVRRPVCILTVDFVFHGNDYQIDEKAKEINRLEDVLKERPTMEEVEETIRSASRHEEASVISTLWLPVLAFYTENMAFLNLHCLYKTSCRNQFWCSQELSTRTSVLTV
jgi:hypothetical protein